MTWTRLDDDFTDKPEMLCLSRSARLLHVEALVWCNRFLTDGAIPAAALPRFTDSPEAADDIAELVDAGIWTVTSTGWQADWTGQEPATRVTARKAYRAQVQANYRDRGDRHKRGDHSQCTAQCARGVTSNATGHKPNNVTGLVTAPRPVPSRPLGRDGEEEGKTAAPAAIADSASAASATAPAQPGRGGWTGYGPPPGVTVGLIVEDFIPLRKEGKK